jgi:hypothetical protein
MWINPLIAAESPLRRGDYHIAHSLSRSLDSFFMAAYVVATRLQTWIWDTEKPPPCTGRYVGDRIMGRRRDKRTYTQHPSLVSDAGKQDGDVTLAERRFGCFGTPGHSWMQGSVQTLIGGCIRCG